MLQQENTFYRKRTQLLRVDTYVHHRNMYIHIYLPICMTRYMYIHIYLPICMPRFIAVGPITELTL